jgi:hypothetical protein
MIASVHTPEASFAHLLIPPLFVFGINYHTTPLEVREKVSFETAQLDEVLRDLEL